MKRVANEATFFNFKIFRLPNGLSITTFTSFPKYDKY